MPGKLLFLINCDLYSLASRLPNTENKLLSLHKDMDYKTEIILEYTQ